MAGNIKGITIEIGAETKKFKNGLAELNKSSKKLQNELKAVDKALELDPTNTDLIRQKQELLKKAIEETETKVKALKAAKDKADADMRNGTEINQEEYRQLQREIAFAESNLESLQEQSKSSNIVKYILGDAKEKFGDFAKKAAVVAAGAAAVATGLGVCAKKADELKQSYNTLQTQTNATDAEMAGLEQSLKNIYANNYGESFEDIATSMAEVKNQTGLAGEELEKATENALALRDTFEFEVAESTRAADMMMKQFGITSDEAYNLIAQGAQNGLNKNDNLLDSINEYSVHFQQLGFDADEMFNMFSNGAQTGVFDIDKLGDAVKEFGIRVKDGTADDAFEELGLNAEQLKQAFTEGGESAKEAFKQVNQAIADCDDKVLQNQIGVTMYGTMWEDMGIEAVKALSDTNGEFDKTADNLEKIKEIKYDDLGSAFEGIGRQIEVGMIIPIGEKLLPYVNDFANWINEKMPQIQAVFDTAMTAIGDSIEFVKSIFEDFMTSNDDANTKVSETWNTIQETISNVTTAIGDIFSSVVELFQTIWEEWGEEISGYIDMVFNNIKIIIETTLGVIQGIINAITALIKGDWEGVFNALNDIVQTIFNGIIDYFNNTVGRFIEAGEKLVNGLKQSITDKINDFKEIGKQLIEGLWEGMVGAKDWIVDKVEGFANTITDTVKGIFDIDSPSRVFAEIGKNIVLGLEEGISKNGGYAVEEIDKLCNQILNTADNISTGIITRDKNTGQVIVDNTYKTVMKKLDLYYKDRDKRVSLMDKATESNIKQLQKEVSATDKATQAKIKLYEQEYKAKVNLLDDSTNEATKALQAELDAIDKAEEERQREKETEEYENELSSLNDQLTQTEDPEEISDIKGQIEKLKADREETLRKQALEDKKEAIRQEMELVREQAEEKKKELEEELERKKYELEQQRIAEIEHLNAVIALMQQQVAKKEELEKLQTEIKDTELKLQTGKLDAETKKQTENDLAELKEQESNLKLSLSNDEANLRAMTPKILSISQNYGDAFLTGFTSTESAIKDYIDSLVEYMKEQLESIGGDMESYSADGSHRTGLREVPFDGYTAILHKGAKVLTQPETDRYEKGIGFNGNNTSITQNFYNVKEERTAFEAYRQTRKSLRQLGLA